MIESRCKFSSTYRIRYNILTDIILYFCLVITNNILILDTSLAAYDNTVMESIYLNLTQYTLPVAGKLYLYLQNRLKSLFCLICRESLTLIDNHIESEEHLEKIRHAHSFQLLKQYHEQFLSLPPALQIEQINFHPTRRICSLCGIRCPTLEAVIAHLGSREHAYNVENRDAENGGYFSNLSLIRLKPIKK